MTYATPKVVAEIGAMHLGSMARAKKLITLAKRSGADYVKFQKRKSR
jgi:sialic acid synthase SpsE